MYINLLANSIFLPDIYFAKSQPYYEPFHFMKIVLVNHQDPSDINSFSGISYFMSRAIKSTFEEVLEYNNFEKDTVVYNVLEGHLGKTLKPIGKKLSDFLKVSDIKADFVLCQGGNSCIPFYNHHTPIAFWNDTTWSSFLKRYENQKKFDEFKRDYRYLYLWDKKAFERADVLIFSSDYVAEACLKNYKPPHNKVKVVPFGANLFSSSALVALKASLQKKLDNEMLNLTFIGKDWKRKGLITAYHLTKKLNLAGIKAKLNVIGCYPDVEYICKSPFVNITGFIDKFDKKEHAVFESILNDTHFLVHPASSEPFGIVLCEANAYGIPVLGTSVEGLKTIIRQGKNGFLFDKSKFIDETVLLIKGVVNEWDRDYPLLFYSSLAEYNQRLNWEVNAGKVKSILNNEAGMKSTSLHGL